MLRLYDICSAESSGTLEQFTSARDTVLTQIDYPKAPLARGWGGFGNWVNVSRLDKKCSISRDRTFSNLDSASGLIGVVFLQSTC